MFGDTGEGAKLPSQRAVDYSSLGLCEFYFPLQEASNEQHSVIKYSKRHYVKKNVICNCLTTLQTELMGR